MNLVVARGLYTAEHYISTRQVAFTSAFANDRIGLLFVLFALCKALARWQEMRLRRRVRAPAFCELWGLALMGALSSDPLFRVTRSI